jgi:hypothetical protein
MKYCVITKLNGTHCLVNCEDVQGGGTTTNVRDMKLTKQSFGLLSQYSPLKLNQHFHISYGLHIQGRRVNYPRNYHEAGRKHQTKRRYIPEVCHFENLIRIK